MIIYMKNSAVIKTADSLDKVRRDSVTGCVVGLDWTHREGECLYYVDPKEIIAIVDDLQVEGGTTLHAPDAAKAAAESS